MSEVDRRKGMLWSIIAKVGWFEPCGSGVDANGLEALDLVKDAG